MKNQDCSFQIIGLLFTGLSVSFSNAALVWSDDDTQDFLSENRNMILLWLELYIFYNFGYSVYKKLNQKNWENS